MELGGDLLPARTHTTDIKIKSRDQSTASHRNPQVRQVTPVKISVEISRERGARGSPSFSFCLAHEHKHIETKHKIKLGK